MQQRRAAAEFEGFRHGYTGTIYKGQGKTLDHTYLLHTHHWRAAASYVALTRQRESAQVFVAEDTARDAQQFARQRAAELVRRDQAPALPVSEREQVHAFWDRTVAAGVAARTGTSASAKPQAEQDAPSAGEGWLIAPRVSPDGKNSLGRGTGAGEIAAVVAGDKAVQREREARWSYLRGAYRDPHAARAALDELVKRQRWTSAAARIEADPLQLGELRGKEGLFAGATARAERQAAQRAAGAIGPSLERIGEAEARAERTYRPGVEAQRSADANGGPRLSAMAEAAIGVVTAAPDKKARAGDWRAVQADERVAGELRAFGAAVEQRFGEEGVRAMLRAGGQPGVVTVPSVTPEQRQELDRVAELTAALKAGERAGANLARREAENERQGQRRGMRMQGCVDKALRQCATYC